MESLILAQDERWRHASYMQVERSTSVLSGERVSNTWGTCPGARDNFSKRMLKPVSSYGGIVA